MTDTLQRPARSTARRPDAVARRPLEVGLLGALWAVCAGLVAIAVPVLLVWAADARSGSSAAEALRAVGQVWLASHGAGLEVPGGTFGLTPMGLLALPLVLLLRAAGHGVSECRATTLRHVSVLAVSIAVPYGVLAAVVSALSATDAARPIAWQALLAGWVVAGIGAFAGALRGAGLWPAVLPALPERVARLVAPTAAAVAVIVAGGALVASASLARHLGRAAELAAATAPGAVGGVGLLLLGLALLPNAAVWGSSWLAGPGFHVGVGTAVGPYGTELGPVPSLPLLAALPGPVPAWVAVVALVVPLAGGALGGVLVVRRLRVTTWLVGCREAALVGPCAGLVVGLLGWLSGGPAGGARLTDVGPTPWLLGLVVAAEVAVAAALAGGLVAFRRTRP